MEAPNPFSITVMNPDIQIAKEEKKYLVKSDNKNYNLNLKNCSSYIIIYCYYIKNEKKNEYEQRYSLEELKQNKYLDICESIDELYAQLKIEFDKNITNIKENKDNINIFIPINHIKIKEITFTLPQIIKGEIGQIEDLKKEISILKNENKSLKKSIEKLENENKLINNKVLNLENDNKILFEKINNLENILKNDNSSLIKSNNLIDNKNMIDNKNLIDNNNLNDNKNMIDNINLIDNTNILKDNFDKQKILIKWIEQKTKKKNLKFQLIFRKSDNGHFSKDFHKYCDNKGPTLSIIETDRNSIIGGFTPLNFMNDAKGIEAYDFSNQSFIFSLNSMKKYDLINPKKNRAIYNWEKYGPNFGNGNIRLNSDLNLGESYTNKNGSFINDNTKFIDKDSFETNELEVFQVIY